MGLFVTRHYDGYLIENHFKSRFFLKAKGARIVSPQNSRLFAFLHLYAIVNLKTIANVKFKISQINIIFMFVKNILCNSKSYN
jgi:hypothetical protein